MYYLDVISGYANTLFKILNSSLYIFYMFLRIPSDHENSTKKVKFLCCSLKCGA